MKPTALIELFLRQLKQYVEKELFHFGRAGGEQAVHGKQGHVDGHANERDSLPEARRLLRWPRG